MSEDGDGPKYTFQTENGETKSMSRGYTGKAVASYPNGDLYDGDFIDGIREGRGEYRYASNGDKYDGEWRVNCKHGIGKMSYNGKGEYHGYWENGRRHGEGTFTYPNGDVYSGWWRFGEKEGTGTYLFKETAMRLQGQWEKSEVTEGKWVYPNGIYFHGKFENNKPKGEGIWYFKNGNTLKGCYEQKPKELDEDEEEPEEDDENAAKKPKFDLVWKSETNIAEAAHLVNSVEQ